ncbi:MAG: hypothetical protein ACD_38C00169G0021 [uncultured bacterium]|uniref:Uncharacterized protein n=1 Tax=Candidatus Daviesbacteria bacterium GW2011_GWC2_40_12 TaxID=1618431 RepID=A0A0G0QP43_9BACT|nr:MAG: hypothetical protein ACD_38C00169G0021 [uncultured bacterium]KKR15755.1 MAG: hypothetical protein UT45_C0014G0013 [Candidatus Daviesbacteria bacterium GW2011_GWA2_39_33]KKR25257.1 MAG: hypothetical protein UT54_C0005G0017 [Candidatus Daviesbacteria bacterium GW2011_GWB1_39_5]KKR41898.1 MAG: hypothetical protein UT77_C0005G0013 [Candidatus Daviesbacteria bacterium GW2011_GWC2_40_12]
MADWEKVEMSPTWDYENEKELIGVYLSKEVEVGPNKSNLYSFKKSDGLVVGIWGSTILDNRFKGIAFGEEVKVVYLGMVKNEKTGREYHNFEIYHRPAQPENEFEED